MAEDADDGVHVVHLRRRTLPEQVEYLILHVALLTSKVGRLERDAADLRDEVAALRSRLQSVERATPWMKPKTGPPLPPEHLIEAVDPRDEPVEHRVEPSNLSESMRQLQAEMNKLWRHQRDPEDEGD